MLWEILQAILPEISTRLGERYSIVEAQNKEAQTKHSIESKRLRGERDRLLVQYKKVDGQAIIESKTIRDLTAGLTGVRAFGYGNNDLMDMDNVDVVRESIQTTMTLYQTLSNQAVELACLAGKASSQLRQHMVIMEQQSAEWMLINRLDWTAWTTFLQEGGVHKNKSARRRYMVMKCPMKDCRGFVSNYWKCDLCKQRVCKDCREPITLKPGIPVRSVVQIEVVEENSGKNEKTSTSSQSVVVESDSDEEGVEEAGGTVTTDPQSTKKTRKTRFDPKAHGHVCNPDSIATVKLLKRTTQNCPKCATPITRSEGCDQMWCTQCQTAFSWKTGEIVTGRVHNPHFYEWQRENSKDGTIPREIGDVPCGGMPNYYSLFNTQGTTFWLGEVFIAYPSKPRLAGALLAHAHRHVTHLYEIELPLARRPLRMYGHNHDLGMGYLLKRYDEKYVRSQLSLRERHMDWFQSLIDLIEMSWTVMTDLFRSVPDVLKKPPPVCPLWLPLEDPWSGSGIKVDLWTPELKNEYMTGCRQAEEWAQQLLNLMKYVNGEFTQLASDHKRKHDQWLFQHVDVFEQALKTRQVESRVF